MNAQGAAIFKPIAREYAKPSPIMWVAAVGGVLTVLIVALMLRTDDPKAFPLLFKILGSLALAPALVWGGYEFTRDHELQPHRGMNLWLRVGACSLIYAALWGVFAFVTGYLFGDAELEMLHYLYILPPLIALGGTAGFASMEIDYTSGLLHYGVYFGATVGLRLLAGLPPFYG